MKIQEAKRIVKELAKGRYHSVSYDISEHTDGEIVIECSVYIEKCKSHRATTFQGAINKLMKEIGLMPESVEEAQEIDDIEREDNDGPRRLSDEPRAVSR